MADVFLAIARGPAGFNKLAVIKRMRNPGDEEHLQMFLDEARLSARLSHPNIVHTYEVGQTEGTFFLVMEYLEGQPLNALLAALADRGSGLSQPVAAFIAAQVLRGLHYAHELTDYDGAPLGVVHRDVSPQNVFVTYGGEVKLLDFGIAKAKVNATHTETGVLKGKIRYMAPEQAGEKDVDRRVDLFAIGIVLWEMLARRRLFEGDSISVLNRIGRDDAPLLRTVRPDLDPELEAICARALRRDAAERYQTAEEMRLDLERYLIGRGAVAHDKELARLLTEGFQDRRDNARARIKRFVDAMPSDNDRGSLSAFAAAGDQLPTLLGEGSGPKGPPAPPSMSTPGFGHTTAKPAKKGPAIWGYAVGGAVLLALGLVALRSRGPEAPPPAAAAAPAETAAPPAVPPPAAAASGEPAPPAASAAPPVATTARATSATEPSVPARRARPPRAAPSASASPPRPNIRVLDDESP